MTEQDLAWLASVERGEIEIGPFGRQYRVERPRGRPAGSDTGGRTKPTRGPQQE
jgi:hypothetical protein